MHLKLKKCQNPNGFENPFHAYCKELGANIDYEEELERIMTMGELWVWLGKENIVGMLASQPEWLVNLIGKDEWTLLYAYNIVDLWHLEYNMCMEYGSEFVFTRLQAIFLSSVKRENFKLN